MTITARSLPTLLDAIHRAIHAAPRGVDAIAIQRAPHGRGWTADINQTDAPAGWIRVCDLARLIYYDPQAMNNICARRNIPIHRARAAGAPRYISLADAAAIVEAEAPTLRLDLHAIAVPSLS